MIKYMSTGGVMSLGTTIDSQQMSFEEMKAICDTAKLYNMTIATHAHGTSGIKDAIRAGVTSVEHGMMMDEEGVQLMKEYGTTLVPTLIAAERIIVKGKEIGTPDWAIAKAEYVFGNATRNFKRCLDEGVKIAFGTDSGTPYNFHGKQTYEFELMVKYGMTPTQALMAATKGSSELMRKDHEIGSIEPGKFADCRRLRRRSHRRCQGPDQLLLRHEGRRGLQEGRRRPAQVSRLLIPYYTVCLR